jgi:hypothetical protein
MNDGLPKRNSAPSPLRAAPFIASKNAYLTFNRGGPALWAQSCGPSPWWKESASSSSAISPFAELRKKKDPLHIFAADQKIHPISTRPPLSLVSSRSPSRHEPPEASTRSAPSLKDVIMGLLSDSPGIADSHSQQSFQSPPRPAATSPSTTGDMRSESMWRAASRPPDLTPAGATSLPNRFRSAAGVHPRGDASVFPPPLPPPPPPQLCHPPFPGPPPQTVRRPPLTAGSAAAAMLRDLSVSGALLSPPRAAVADGRRRPPARSPCEPPPAGPPPAAAIAFPPAGWAATMAPAVGRRARGEAVGETDAGGPGVGRPLWRVQAAADGQGLLPAGQGAGAADDGLAPW